ncbi:unnamed protein product [Sphenostylis stenocarpa]|uniref:RING-type E3 ubiquitin transferase n=1 Tax=Sphenostylis stenocarpa TaxID=92480 RepID=A0AA86S793_9FABA|nr:unnamed protein product [Sphenostylis stenocarpa]
MASSMEYAGGMGEPLYRYNETTLVLNERNSYNVMMFGSNEYATMIPGGVFRISIKVNHNMRRRLLLYSPASSIPCQSFFQEGKDFLRTLLAPLSPRLFCSVIIDEIVELIASEVCNLFQVDAASASASFSSESQPPEIPLWIVIRVSDTGFLASLQDFTTLRLETVPASKEAIETLLKNCRVMVAGECCCVCLEEFDVNGECHRMPCHHSFHQPCIVHWLQTSHTCPLCRYPLPTMN